MITREQPASSSYFASLKQEGVCLCAFLKKTQRLGFVLACGTMLGCINWMLLFASKKYLPVPGGSLKPQEGLWGPRDSENRILLQTLGHLPKTHYVEMYVVHVILQVWDLRPGSEDWAGIPLVADRKTTADLFCNIRLRRRNLGEN